MKRNLTLAIEEDVLHRARIVAAQRKRTLTSIVRDYLCGLAREDRERAASLSRLRRLMEKKPLVVGPRRWRRERLHER
ncbi:MAG: hypothetical protein HYY93_10765 [Planctomycetes bacterium]|nr:hypothetical protein [Planctomycetota bacterium]